MTRQRKHIRHSKYGKPFRAGSRDILVRKFKAKMGKNIMTTYVLGYYRKGNIVIELSQGMGIENEPIFGVTAKEHRNKKWIDVNDKSKMFYSKQDAMNYIKTF